MPRYAYLKHQSRISTARYQTDRLAVINLRPDQLAYYVALLESWGVRSHKEKDMRLYGLWFNPESKALRKTLDQRP